MELKKLICPSCGKELVNLKITAKERNTFWCDDCKIDIEIFNDNTMQMFDDLLLVEWVNDDEGLCGDYHPDDPNDVNLLRFDVSYNETPDSEELNWVEVEDASYCTLMPAHASLPVLLKGLYTIFKEYREVIDDYIFGSSVKKLGECLSYIDENI